jgi:hypothetical protein
LLSPTHAPPPTWGSRHHIVVRLPFSRSLYSASVVAGVSVPFSSP